jgi:hypothetical protein
VCNLISCLVTVQFEVKVKVKCTLVQVLRLCTSRTAHRGSRGIAPLFHDHGTRRGEGSASRLGRSLPGKTPYPLYRRQGVPHGRSGQVRKIWPAPGFDPQTVQPVASRYTDYATRSTQFEVLCVILCIALVTVQFEVLSRQVCNLRYCPGNYTDGPTGSPRYRIRDSRSLGRELKQVPPEY